MYKIINNQIALLNLFIRSCLLMISFLFAVSIAQAATLQTAPSTGVYSSGSTFTISVLVNTGGKSVNAAEGVLSFNPRELSVVSVSKAGSIFNLWVTEPKVNHSAGTIEFSGGAPSGYSGGQGRIMTVTFRTLGSGSTKVKFKNGTILANDGKGTNILNGMSGGNYTIKAQAVTPEPEKIIEYKPKANTPKAPKINSSTHPDQNKWYNNNDVKLSWSLPTNVTAVRTLLNKHKSDVPTKLYSSPIKTISLSDIDDGVSYFHIQFKNSDGWGRVSSYKFAIDTEKPEIIRAENVNGEESDNPLPKLKVISKDKTSGVGLYKIKVDDKEVFEHRPEKITKTASGTYEALVELPLVEPGYHTVSVEVLDQAGNSDIKVVSFTVKAFEPPVFTDYPEKVSDSVTPLIKGKTRPRSTVTVDISRVGEKVETYEVTSDDNGDFVVIPSGSFKEGVYELKAKARDEFGAISEYSNPVRMLVQKPGYLRLGSMLISFLSVLIPIIALLGMMLLMLWFFFVRFRSLKRKVYKESAEALDILNQEFSSLLKVVSQQRKHIEKSRRGKGLTKTESQALDNIEEALETSKSKVSKEIKDVSKLVARKG